MSYPLDWLTSTFRSRERTVELFQPELENNVLAQHDFDLAVRFLPGSHSNWPMLYGSGAAGATALYGYRVTRPPWGQRKTFIFGGAAYVVGMMYGGFRRFVAHRQFAEALEDPEGFVLALSHIHKKLGGDGNIGFTLRRIQQKKIDTTADTGDYPQGSETGFENRTRSDPVGNNNPNSSTAFKNRWDEIRAANARNISQQSTWDAIRQRQERSRIPVPSAYDGQSTDKPDDRATAQARFEAMLEAERRRGQDRDREMF
ncbi:hypothetical protein F5J12DRAFT_835947 [Pisolithus orientalis]|uniref:uncharacterized protein n=1 Tax=Pisolithus orientalis TaxID=936130 RepID=UPI00222568B2|nr:uncharacterized protein F5J12DRAFT_835947 [Pisolithus orientalis]KAI6005286.1 hypothetical protein F5J12DRAFT_835947 [Pisolithus orientalis]